MLKIIFISLFALSLNMCSGKVEYFDSYVQREGTVNHLYFSEVISEDSYMKLVNAFNALQPHDTLIVHFNSPGGTLTHTIIIAEAMKKSYGKIIAQLDSGCYSGCAVLVGYADELRVGPHAEIMWHMPRTQFGVITEDSINPADRMTVIRYKKILSECCTRYMYSEEAQKMYKGADFYLTGKEFKRRWDLVNAKN